MPLIQGNEQALLLGTGGVSKAIAYALKQMGIGYTLVSRNPNTNAIGYEDLTEAIIKQHTIIVNCTPLGMHPYEDKMPAIPYHLLTPEHLLYDCIYNPEMTRFLRMGQKQGCRVKNGLEMLHIQADRAWEIWRILN
jgi:shikimate dehydrogenase